MPFPSHIARVLDAYRVAADTKAALYDLYVSLGDEVLEVFADIAEGVTSAATLTPDDTLSLRAQVVERYVRRNHPLWLAGRPTASLWHPREAEGRASGAAVPLGDPSVVAARVVGENQPVPEGILILGRNAHYGGRAETISFDVVAKDVEDAVALATAAGQQHTIPGSAGETSGTYDSERNLALIWEVQPNVYKPSAGRNRSITKVYRRHRNWHLVTLAAALEWLRGQNAHTFILRGDALAATHEVNRDKPVSERIAELHEQTVGRVISALGLELHDTAGDDEMLLLESCVMNHALRKHVLKHGAAAAIRRLTFTARAS